jgi:hypothetical protein
MPIEGPLRELGIHDVFQLLDLSRKTGALRVTSGPRDNDGMVYFKSGRLIHASIRSNPHPLGTMLIRAGKINDGDLERARAMQRRSGNGRRLGEILVEIGAITPRELERQVRLQIEAVVFELMSWREGFFSFEERSVDDAPIEAAITISTESLLMEGARRIDEWSRIADKVPSLAVIPVLAPVHEDHPSLLDLLPNEWAVLALIDGVKDLREISHALSQSEFDIAKVAYGLVTTGIIDFRNPDRVSGGHGVAAEDPQPYIDRAVKLLAAGKHEEALSAGRSAIATDPSSAEARLATARALSRLGRLSECLDELRKAVTADPINADTHLELGYAAARRGDLQTAIASWAQFLRLAPAAPIAAMVKSAMESASRLANLLQAHAGA